MIFSFFQNAVVDEDDEPATGTYADGAIGMSEKDVSHGGRHRSGCHHSAHERDYGANRVCRHPGAGMVA